MHTVPKKLDKQPVPATGRVAERPGFGFATYPLKRTHCMIIPKIEGACAVALLLSAFQFAALADTSKLNDTLETAASACEDMIEIAAADGVVAASAKIRDLRAALKKMHRLLPSDVAEQLELRAKRLEDLAKGDSVTDLSLEAVETFRDIIHTSDWRQARIPESVALLDYSGFKLGILADTQKPDWAAVETAAKEAHETWLALKPRLNDAALRNLMTTIDETISQSAARKDTFSLHYAAKIELDSVDVLEHHFTKAK